MSLSIKFYLNTNKSTKGDKYPIYCRITYNRKKSELATDHYCSVKKWNDSSQRSKIGIIDDALSLLENKIRGIKNQLDRDKAPVSAKLIKDLVTGRSSLNPNILDYFHNHIISKSQKKDVKKGTLSGYRTTLMYLREFIQKDKIKDLVINMADYKFIKDFDTFLHQKGLKQNSANKHHSRLRTLLIEAIREDLIIKNPYNNFKLKYKSANRTYLTNEELKKLKQSSLGENNSLQRVRDIFLFSVYTGLRFNDAQNLTIDAIKRDGDKIYIETIQEKTDEMVKIPLNRTALDIIDKYDNKERAITGKVLPKISNQKLNAYLKEIAILSNIDKNITHHVARHTYATTILLQNNVPMETVQKLLGHNNMKTTQVYGKITDEKIFKDTEKIKDL